AGACGFFFLQAEDGIRDDLVTGVQTCALPILQQAAHDAARPTRAAVAGLRRGPPAAPRRAPRAERMRHTSWPGRGMTVSRASRKDRKRVGEGKGGGRGGQDNCIAEEEEGARQQ